MATVSAPVSRPKEAAMPKKQKGAKGQVKKGYAVPVKKGVKK